MTKNNQKIPIIKNTQASRELNEGSVLVIDCEEANYRLLNDSGSFLWKQIDGQRSLQELSELLAQEFSIDTEQALNDTQIFLAEMEKREMLQWQS